MTDSGHRDTATADIQQPDVKPGDATVEDTHAAADAGPEDAAGAATADGTTNDAAGASDVATVADATVEDTAVADAAVADAAVADAVFVMQTLQTEGLTPNAAAVTWDAVAMFQALGSIDHYDVRFSISHDIVISGGGTEFNANDDPNLGYYLSPFGPDIVHRTTLIDLAPRTTYYLRLTAYNSAGSPTVAAQGTLTTPLTPADSLTIFADSLGTGHFYCELQGQGDVLTAPVSRSHTGTAALGCVGDGTWINIKLRDLAIDLSPLTNSFFVQAYLELYIRVDCGVGAPQPLNYAELFLGQPGAPSFDYNFPRYITLSSIPLWHRIQVPLHLFSRAGEAMTPELFGPELDRFFVGFHSPDGCEILLDDIVIRYNAP